MDRQTALERAGEIIKRMAESIAKSGMHNIKESEIAEIAEGLKD
jgi:hypothetical protein